MQISVDKSKKYQISNNQSLSGSISNDFSTPKIFTINDEIE